VELHVANRTEAGAVASTLAAAFYEDPVWSWAFPEPERRHSQLLALWGLYVLAGIDHRWVFTTPGYEAAAVWIPPGCEELGEPYASELDPLLDDLLGSRADLVREVFSRFDDAHPTGQRYFYLSFLGAHPDHRGMGIGMALLAESLARIDQQHLPAYLESSNPANLVRYESVGFRIREHLDLPEGGPIVTTMWREPGGPVGSGPRRASKNV
jgi:ribosomal protein S18 acetylase RimI-like enzyme